MSLWKRMMEWKGRTIMIRLLLLIVFIVVYVLLLVDAGILRIRVPKKAFGLEGKGQTGLTGKFYDLKQTPERTVLPVTTDGEHQILEEFFKKNWDASLLDGHYFSPVNSLKATQFYIPTMQSEEAPEAFKVEKDVLPSCWVIHYKGTVTASKTTRFRFRGRGDNIMAVRFNNRNVFFNMLQDPNKLLYPLFPDNQPLVSDRSIMSYGAWIDVKKGESYPMEVILSDYGGVTSFFLCIEEEKPDSPYRIVNNQTLYPLFQLKKGVPLEKHQDSMDLSSGAAVPVDTNQNVFEAK